MSEDLYGNEELEGKKVTRARQSSTNATASQFVASGIIEVAPNVVGTLNELQISAPVGSYADFRVESASITLIAV